MPAAELGPIDVVLLTHDHHADNLDDAGRALLPAAPVVVTTAAGAERLGGTTRGLRPWDTTRLEAPGRPAIEVTATPCRHGPPLSRPLVGDVIGFALAWDGQEHGVLWISGDTVLYDGVRSVAERLTVSLAVLHLGEARFPVTGPVRYTMTAADGVELCRTIRPRTVVPVHYEGWSHFRQGRTAIEQALADAPDVRDSFRDPPDRLGDRSHRLTRDLRSGEGPLRRTGHVGCRPDADDARRRDPVEVPRRGPPLGAVYGAVKVSPATSAGQPCRR